MLYGGQQLGLAREVEVFQQAAREGEVFQLSLVEDLQQLGLAWDVFHQAQRVGGVFQLAWVEDLQQLGLAR
jgi:hypothetical protein